MKPITSHHPLLARSMAPEKQAWEPPAVGTPWPKPRHARQVGQGVAGPSVGALGVPAAPLSPIVPAAPALPGAGAPNAPPSPPSPRSAEVPPEPAVAVCALPAKPTVPEPEGLAPPPLVTGGVPEPPVPGSPGRRGPEALELGRSPCGLSRQPTASADKASH